MSDVFKAQFLAAMDGPEDALNALLEDHLTVVQTRMRATVQEILAVGDIDEATAAYAMLFNEVSGLVVRFDAMMALFENAAAPAPSMMQKLRKKKGRR